MITTINQLVRRVCINFAGHYGKDECVLRTSGEGGSVTVEEEQKKCSCLVLNGKPCGYFRTSVLPPAGYRYCPTYKLARLRREYGQIDPNIGAGEADEIRRCDCGQPLLPRFRFCEKCSEKRAKEATLISKQKQRSKKD